MGLVAAAMLAASAPGGGGGGGGGEAGGVMKLPGINEPVDEKRAADW